jgi:tetratricopeptide (TPR) repeat protein
VLLILIIAIAKCGGSPTRHAAAVVLADAAPVAVVAPPPIDAAIAPPPVDAAEVNVVTPPHVSGSDAPAHASSHDAVPPTHRPPPAAGGDAEALYKQGVQAMVRGDTRASIAALTKATRVRPGYAPAWRVLGQVYKKSGEKGQAKAAFQRYLTIAPSASDAPQIRDLLKSL